MEKPWLTSYQSGIPDNIDATRYASLVELFHQACHDFKDLTAYENLNYSLSYQELFEKSQLIASFLKQHGVKKGDRVAIMLPNLLQYPIAIFGILQIGAIVVNTNPLYTVDELTTQLQDAEVSAIFVLNHFTSLINKVLARFTIKTIIITKIADLLPAPKRWLINFVVKHTQNLPKECQIQGSFFFRDAIKIGQKESVQDIELNHNDIAFLQYTGGTTGVAKGAMLTHGNMLANVLQAYSWITPLNIGTKDVVITALPLYHIFALTANCLTFLKAGAKNILITNPRDMKRFINQIKKQKFTALTGVNTLFNALLNHPDFIKIDFAHVKLTLSGGMALQKAVAERWHYQTKSRILEAYGLTETSPAVTINPMNLTGFNGSIGLPLPSTIVSIRDDNNNNLPYGEIGEICVFGPQVMLGYWRHEKETTEVFTTDGFLKTGDLGTMDEAGFVYLVDRKKELIIVSGFNVYPNEVEQVLTQHPDVLEAGVTGIYDDTGNERVKAFVVKKRQDLTAEELIAHCRQHLTPYKVPKIIEFRTSLPKTNVGKILRRALT